MRESGLSETINLLQKSFSHRDHGENELKKPFLNDSVRSVARFFVNYARDLIIKPSVPDGAVIEKVKKMILVIGYGNSLCGDDGVGPYIVERLALADAESRRAVEYLAFRQLTPELAEPISRAETVIFVDAADGETPGHISCLELTPLAKPFETGSGAFTHHVKASILLENARFLYGRHPAAYLYTVAGENFNLGNSFSPAVELALPSLFDQLKARIANA